MTTRDVDLSISDTRQPLMQRISDKHSLHGEEKTLCASSRLALAEIQGGKIKRFDSVDDLVADLHTGD